MSRLPAGRRHSVQFTLNGKPCSGEAEPRMLLTDFLRHQIGATGTHVGCEHGVCGACTVEIDGKLARACLTLAVQAEGCAVRTVEGLAPAPGRLGMLASGVQAQSRAAMRVLYRGNPDVARSFPSRKSEAERSGSPRPSDRPSVPLHRLHSNRAGGHGSR